MVIKLHLLGSFLVLASALVLSGQHASAQQKGLMTLKKAHIVLGPPMVRVHGGYFEFSNATRHKITILGATSKAYRRVEIHRSSVEGGIVVMEPVNSLTVEAGGELTFKAGGLHLMLIEPNRELAPKEKVEVTLLLADKRKVSASFVIMRRHATAPKTASDHGRSKHAH